MIQILVVEDEAITAENIRKKLIRLGYEAPTVVMSGEAALDQVTQIQPDLVLMDIMLAGEMDGVTAAEQIRRRFDLPVIYLTAHADEVVLQRAKLTEPFGYLLKPFEIRELRSTIEMALYKHKIDQTLRRRNRELALLNRIILAAVTTPEAEPAALLEIACRELALTFELPWVSAALINPLENTAAVVAEYRLDRHPPVLDQTISLRDDVGLRFLSGHKKPLVIEEAQTNPYLAVFHERLRQGNLDTLVILPLVVEQQTSGSLNLYISAGHTLTAEQIDLAWNVAGEVARALAYARLADQYRQAQKLEAVGRLAAGIAHDFNNLLTAINGFADLLQERFELDGPQQRYVKNILGAGRRAEKLVQQLLAFSRKQLVKPQVLNLNETVTTISKMLERIIGEHITLNLTLAADCWPVEIDPTQLEQVIVNLAVNARDAMPTGGQLTLKTANVALHQADLANYLETPPGDYVLLAVSDTGCGMDADLQAHIFEPFFTTKEQGHGTGLGLAQVYGAVKQSQGDLRVDSQKGRGATFSLYLPRAKKSVTTPERPPAKLPPPTGSETVLLAEDDPGVRELVRHVLQQQGYHLLEAPNAQTARQLADKYTEPIHLLLTDVVMPGANGKELADYLRQTRPALDVIFMSGYADEVLSPHVVLEAGINFLEKPFSPNQLVQKIRTVLDHRPVEKL